MIAPISVPRMLAEGGYTADVAAQRLHYALNKVDALNKVEDPLSNENVRVGPVNSVVQTDLPNIVIPTIGLSLETVAANIRIFFPIAKRWIAKRWNISGELTMAEERLWLRLRMNGEDFYTSPNGVDQEHSDDLLAPAAEKVSEQILLDSGTLTPLQIVRRIIAVGPETDPSVKRAHNDAGNILLAQGKTEEAIAEYRKAIEFDPLYAWPHNNLGYAFSGQGKTEDAIAEYCKAIELDPSLEKPHNNLDYALREQGKTDGADAECRKAKELGAKHAD